jgi:hypothetical protein
VFVFLEKLENAESKDNFRDDIANYFTELAGSHPNGFAS